MFHEEIVDPPKEVAGMEEIWEERTLMYHSIFKIENWISTQARNFRYDELNSSKAGTGE